MLAPLLTQIVEAPLRTEADLPLQVVGVLRPQLQDGQTVANAGLGHGQLVLACARKQHTSVYGPVCVEVLSVFMDILYIYIVQTG